MRMMLKSMLAMMAALAVLMAGPATAQSGPDPIGDWSGLLATPQGELPLILHLTRGDGGALEGELESPNQAPGQMIPLTEISLEGEVLSWSIAALSASFEGTWNAEAEQWQGDFTQGMAMELALSRGLPDALPVIEGLDGRWEGSIDLNGATLRLIVNIVTSDERGTVATLDSPDQMANGLTLTDLARDGQQVSFAYAPGQQTYSGTLDEAGNTIAGVWETSVTEPAPVTFVRTSEEVTQIERNRPQTPEEPFPYTVEEVDFANAQDDTVHLAGSLTLPEGDGPFPAAILITGSGAQDRDESLLGHKPFAVLADHLTRNGIAVLRYDDRGVASSTGDYSIATSADLATDANAAAAFLMTRDDIDPLAIGFIGHSEGGMIGPIAMKDNPYIAYIVMLAGPGTGLDQLMLSQRRLIGETMGTSQEQLDSAEPVMASVFRAIGTAQTLEEGVEAARALLTPDAMVALGTPAETDPQTVLAQLDTRWFHYFLGYDPVSNLERIRVPVLAINGSLDLQVPPAENLAAIAAATAGNSDVTTMELAGLNHLFQTAQTGSVGEYADIEETFAPSALAIVSDWLRERFVN